LAELTIGALSLTRCCPEGFVEGVRRNERVVSAFRVDPVAAPDVVPRIPHQSRTDRVQLDIPTALQEITIPIDQEALEPPLPEVAAVLIAPPIEEGIRKIEAQHRFAQRGADRHFKDEMDVVRHQHKVVEFQAVLLRIG
jgi:hypothetical protein